MKTRFHMWLRKYLRSIYILQCPPNYLKPYLAASSSIYRVIVSNSALPVDTKYRICVISETCLLRANSFLAYEIGSSRFPFGIRNRLRRMSRYRESTRPRWMNASREGGGGLLDGRREDLKDLKDLTVVRRDREGRIGDGGCGRCISAAVLC
jgi:hypothetical protein